MSGNRRTSGSGGRPGGGARYDDCSSLSFEASLYSPVPSVITKLKVGDYLRIELDDTEKTVLALNNRREIAGTLVGKNMLKIIDCLRKNFKYKGEITKISGGSCTITIMPK
jgi:hypothetical protein